MTGGGRQFTRIDETIDILKNVFRAHIPVSKNMPFFAKCRYLALMIRRIIPREAMDDRIVGQTFLSP